MATFPELTARIESVRAYMLSAIRDLNNLILIAQKHKPTPIPGLHGLVMSFSGIKTSSKIVDDYQSVQEGLKKLKEKYQKVYPKEFSYLDDETIINMGCLGVIDLFQSDLLTRMEEVRSRLFAKYNRNLKKLNDLNDAIARTPEYDSATKIASDPRMSRYVDQSTKAEDLLATLEDEKEAWVANHQSSYVESTLDFWRKASGGTQGDKVKNVFPGKSVIDSFSDSTSELLHAQYPLSSTTCAGHIKVSDGIEKDAQEDIDYQMAAKKAAHESAVKGFFASDIENKIRLDLDNCQQLVNKLDSATYNSTLGMWVKADSSKANEFRKQISIFKHQNDVSKSDDTRDMELSGKVTSLLASLDVAIRNKNGETNEQILGNTGKGIFSK